MAGKFISFEGPDGAGKSTQIKLLEEELRGRGYRVLLLREPGSTLIGEKIREILLDPAHKAMAGSTEVLLYAAARAQLVEEVILPALAQDKIVLCDRFVHSSLAYQGFGRGLDLDFIRMVNKKALEKRPHLTLILDLEPGEGLKRIVSRRQAHGDRMEQESPEFHRRVRQGFLALAAEDPERCKIIPAAGPVEIIHRQIVDLTEKIL